MLDFEYTAPTKVVFGKGKIAAIKTLIPAGARVMLAYGGGSIKTNGVYQAVIEAITPTCEFSGIEPNPSLETCLKAVEMGKANNITYILAVGGGSVIDACKFITCAMNWDKSPDPFDILLHWGFGWPNEKPYEPQAKVPIGVVLTLPAAGSESNAGAVITNKARKLKRPFAHPSCYPAFCILDPEVCYSIPAKQLANGIIDSYVHVLEQYIGNYQQGRLQDRQCEAIMKSLIEIAPAVMSKNRDYATYADLMWCSNQALTGLIGCGTKACWASHMIGHELTTFYGLDHGQTLALTVPSVMKQLQTLRQKKYEQYAARVFGIEGPDAADKAISMTDDFFKSLGVHTRLSGYGFGPEHFDSIIESLGGENIKLSAEGAIRKAEATSILKNLL